MKGAKNSITDVAGVRVGHLTFARDVPAPSGEAVAARTGLTAVFPAPMEAELRFPFATEMLGAGPEITGFEVTEDFAYLNSPLVVTNAAHVGLAYDAVLSYGFALKRAEIWPPVVIGLNDSWLNGMDGTCLEEASILEAFRRAGEGRPEEGSVGVGTGLRALDAKGGVGTASRLARIGAEAFTCGVLAVSHFGNARGAAGGAWTGRPGEDEGALVLIAATDAPLLAHDLGRLVKGLVARMSSLIPRGGGPDAVLGAAFTTANAMGLSETGPPEFAFRSLAGGFHEEIADALRNAAGEAIRRSLIEARPVRGRAGRLLEPVAKERLIGVFDDDE